MLFFFIPVVGLCPVVNKQVQKTGDGNVRIPEPNLTAVDELVVYHGDAVSVIVLKQFGQLSKIVSQYAKVNIIVPRDETSMANGAKERAEVQPIRNAVFLAKSVEFRE